MLEGGFKFGRIEIIIIPRSDRSDEHGFIEVQTRLRAKGVKHWTERHNTEALQFNISTTSTLGSNIASSLVGAVTILRNAQPHAFMTEHADSRTALHQMEGNLTEMSDRNTIPLESNNSDALSSSTEQTEPGLKISNAENNPSHTIKSSSAIAPSFSGFTPSISWNQGSKAKIRTTLGSKLSCTINAKQVRSDELDLTLSSPAPNDLPTSADIEPSKRGGSGSLESAYAKTRDQSQPSESISTRGVEEITDPSELDYEEDGFDSDASVDTSEDSDEQESGEITSGEDVAMFGSTVQGEYGGASASLDREEQTDAMMLYSDSNPGKLPFGAPRLAELTGSGTIVIESQPSAAEPVPKPDPRLLADLDPATRALQIRYFYAGKNSKTVNLNDAVKCFTCAKPGHLSERCDASKCPHCGIMGQHVSWACPKFRRCQKCAERGHDLSNCPYKLSRPGHKNIICDLCQRAGHPEDECEMIWRTSGKPWESDINPATVNLFCYECGAKGHLGNDCQYRRPGKRSGSSTWSFQYSIKGMNTIKGPSKAQGFPRGGMAIKGRAQQQQQPIETSSSEDERANFYRPPISHPPPGTIRVPSMIDVNRGDHDFRNIAYPNRLYDRQRSRSPDSHRYDGPRGASRALNEPGAYGRFSDSYRPAQSLPPRPVNNAPPRNFRPSDTYRPLPSAGIKAWKKYLT